MTNLEFIAYCEEQCSDGMPWLKGKEWARLSELCGYKPASPPLDPERNYPTFRMDLQKMVNKAKRNLK